MKHKIKLIIFDAYGVILSGGYPLTSKWLAKKFGLDWQEIYKILYVKYFNLAAEKKITQQEAWVKAIKELDLSITVAELKRNHYKLMGVNRRVLSMVERLKKNYFVLLLSKNTRGQFADINHLFPELKKTFGKNIINTWEYNLPKASKETLNMVFSRYSVKPDEVVYTDDQDSNLEPAKEIGVKTILYQSFSQFQKDLREAIK
ncbi:MAG: HAD hydrolase-like protein [Candidatus Magasanikbacteria bacterium]|nr:HAD hydrolase-like protein [Candidatus Magasanikbacteria bacterium]